MGASPEQGQERQVRLEDFAIGPGDGIESLVVSTAKPTELGELLRRSLKSYEWGGDGV